MKSHKSRQAEARRGLAHLGVGNILGLRERLVHGGENHVLHDLRVGRVQRLRVNLDGRDGAVALATTFTAPPPLVASTVRAARLDWICSICCCIRAACFMSFPMLDMVR